MSDEEGGCGGMGMLGFILVLLLINGLSYLFGWGFWVY